MYSGTKNAISMIGVFALVWLCLRWLYPLFSPFALGAVLALAAEPLTALLCRRLRLPRGAAAGIGVSLTFALGAALLLALGAFLLRELGLLAGVLPDLEAAAGTGLSLLEAWLLGLAARAPRSIRPILEENVTGLFSGGTFLLNQAVRYLLGLAGGLLSHVPGSALSLGTGIISAFLISAKLPRIRRWLARRIPREALASLLAAGKRMKGAVAGWLTAQVKLMGVTYAILSLGLLILRIPYALLWALGVSLVDAFPVLGTGTVLLPWAAVCFLQGDIPRAVGLLGLYTVVSLTRSILEPKLVGSHLGLDPLATLVALYAGYRLWGIGGMILAPLLAVMALQLANRPKAQNNGTG
ncbi:MAG: sporulation integral membrane protein YtvI [Eubacteriales bacterium]|nr:sporulation integral membrane protein YtvI [Eubacteriales bacterium]